MAYMHLKSNDWDPQDIILVLFFGGGVGGPSPEEILEIYVEKIPPEQIKKLLL